ncbi:MAG: nucleoside-diphosphate kinase [Candidatus Omnitrophica bacterium]|nr:nucleoside-diphosphate kinase [Candidatus Omnitrophota bacterium]
MNEPTLILIKPDGLVKSLTGNVLTRLSETKLEIVAAKMVKVSDALAREHYESLKDKPFFGELIKYLKGELHNRCKVMAMVYYGEGAIAKVREIAGVTNPEEANSVSIRGQYGRITTKGVYENVIHASSNLQDAQREIKLWFRPDEIIVDLYPTKKVSKNTDEKVWA